MVRTPAARGFTVAEKRSILFERIALYAVFLVALIAAVISFQALTWVGTEMGLRWAAPLVPLAIDGFAVACSVGIVRSQASGEKSRERVSEWVGLFLALALSIAGNILHALHTGTKLIPAQVTIAFAAAVPVVLAYGIHVYWRAMVRGISAHVLADDPDRIHFGIAHLGDENASGPARAARVKPAAPARAVTAAPARQDDARPAAAREATARPEKQSARVTPEHEAAFEEYRTRVQSGGGRMQGGEIAARLGINEGHARNLRKKWDRRIADELAIAEPARDPILEQVPALDRDETAKTA